VPLGHERRRAGRRVQRRVLVEPCVAAVGVEEAQRLLDQPPRPRGVRRPGDHGRRLLAQAVVLLPGAREHEPLERRDVREEVDDRVGAVERAGERGLVEDVGGHGAGAEALDDVAGAVGADDARDAVARADELGDRAAPDDAGRSGDDDVGAHVRVTRRTAQL
jgi:hypothetical protein